MRVCIDIDGVLATEGDEPVYGDEAGWSYEKCVPVSGAVEGMKALKAAGHRLILFSSRWGSNIAKTHEWLEKWDIPFDVLILGQKPSADLYVDDKGLRFESWMELLAQVGSMGVKEER